MMPLKMTDCFMCWEPTDEGYFSRFMLNGIWSYSCDAICHTHLYKVFNWIDFELYPRVVGMDRTLKRSAAIDIPKLNLGAATSTAQVAQKRFTIVEVNNAL